MKSAFFGFLLATALAVSSGWEDVDQPELDSYGIEVIIRAIFENLISQLKEGIPDKNIPPLDPLDIEHQDILILLNDTLRLNGSVSNVTGSNLLSLKMTKLEAKISPLFLETRLDWDAIDVKGLYDIDGSLLSIIPIYGKGKFSGYFDGVYAYLKIELGTKGGELYVRKFDVDFGIKNVSVSIENFLNGLLGDLICEMINENLPTMVEQIKIGYLDAIKEIVVNQINNFLEGKTIDEFLDFIFGFLTTTTLAPDVKYTTTAN